MTSNNRCAIFILVALMLFAMERRGYCDEISVKDIPPGDDKIVGVREGEKAPFTGQLFDPPTALRWANWLQQYKLRLQTDVEMQKRVCEADVKLGERKLEIEQEKNKVVTDDLRKQVALRDVRVLELEKSIDNPPFYRSFWFGAVVGVVTTGALFGVGVWAASTAN